MFKGIGDIMGTRALIKNKGYKDIAIYSDGYPAYIVPQICKGVDLLTLYRAENRPDKNGSKILLSEFDYIYHMYTSKNQRKEIRVYCLRDFKSAKFILYQKFILEK